MAKRVQNGAPVSASKRAKAQPFVAGDAACVPHWCSTSAPQRIPRTKRVFAGMCGVVQSTSRGSVDVAFKIPRRHCALYADFLGADDSCVVKFTASQLDSEAEKAPAVRVPFQLTAVQTLLGELLGPKTLVTFYTTTRGIVQHLTLCSSFTASIRRTCLRVRHLSGMERAGIEWKGWSTGVYLRRHCYAEVRDALLSSLVSGYSTLVAALLPNIGARFDEVIIGTLLRLKNGLVLKKFCDHSCNEAIMYSIGGRSVHAIRSSHAAKAVMEAFVRYPAATCWWWQDRVLQAVSRPSFVGLHTDVMQRACHNFCLLCINDITRYPEQLCTMNSIINLLGRVGCDDHAVYRRLIRQMSSVQDALVELQCHRWREEPLTLGRDLAAAFDVVIWVFDIRTFLAGACLIRLVPVESLWPVAQALLSDFNKKQMVAACGYPGKPTHFFTHVIHAFIQRDPLHFEPYIRLRFMVCGPKEEAWLQRCLSDAKKPTQAVSKVPKAAAYTAPTTRGKRRRECGSV